MTLAFHEKGFTIPKAKSGKYEARFCLQASNLAPKMGHRRLAWQLARRDH